MKWKENGRSGRYYFGILLKGLRATTKNLSQDSLPLG
jgi:hypothetical protein